MNVLSEALVAALSDKDEVRVATLRASLERYALAMSWSRDKFLPAVLAEFDDDLFAQAFILKSIAPDQPETASLLGLRRMRATCSHACDWFTRP